MKRFLLSCVTFATLLGVLLFAAVFLLPDQLSCNSMLGVQRDKLVRLVELKGPRIIFVGGSNVGHGFDSKVIEDAFHYPVMNMGLHAGLGLIYQLRSVQGLVHEGDLVVVVPEFEQFQDDCWGDDELLALVTAVVPEHKSFLPVRQWSRLVQKVPAVGARKLFRFYTLFQSPKSHVEYNEFGDNVSWKMIDMRLPFPSTSTVKPAEDYTGSVIPFINDFVIHCKEMGAVVAFLPPAHEQTSFDREKRYIEKVALELERNGTPYISSPSRYAFPDEQFADTNYHLNRKGVPERMRRVVEDLRTWMACQVRPMDVRNPASSIER